MECVQLNIYNFWLVMISLAGLGYLYYNKGKMNTSDVIVLIYSSVINWYVLKKLCL